MGLRVFTDAKRALLLERLRRHGRIGWALGEAGVVQATFYKTRNREPAFERAVQEALLAAAARMVEDEEQHALQALRPDRGPDAGSEAARDGAPDDGGGRTLADNGWLRTRLQAKADRFRYRPGSAGAGSGAGSGAGHGFGGDPEAAREADRRDVAGKLDGLARRLERGARR